MPNNELQELLGARFKEHTHPTNEAVWNAIEAQLDANQKDRVGIWFWIFNGLAATLLLGMMFQTTNNSGISSESNEVQLSESIHETTPSAENNESVSSKRKQNKGTTPSENNTASSGSSTGSEKGISNNHKNESAKTVKSISEKPAIEQFINIPDISTNFEDGVIVTTHAGPKYSEHDLDELLTRPLNYPELNPLLDETDLGINMNKKIKTRLPIHLGCEFTYLRRQRVAVDPIATYSDSSYKPENDRLANNRHFEVSLFSQFDFTRRFSVSVGFGYSHSRYSSSSDPSTTSLATVSPEKSELNLFTIPIQTKFNFLQKNRLSVNGGLTFQSEFGRVDHTKVDPEEIWTTVPPNIEQESLVVNRINIRQFAFEPYLQLSVNMTPRMSSFANLGYKMYLNQNDINLAPIGRLNYFNADIGLLFRLQ